MASFSYLEKLMQDPIAVEFLQMLRLLDKEKIQFIPKPSLTFPAAEIHSIKKTKNSIQLSTNLLSFVGVTSPLPAYFISPIIQTPEQGRCNQDFLQIFNQRLYLLFYNAWKKYRPIIQITQQQNNYNFYLAALAGNSLAINSTEELTFAAAFGQRWQSKESLMTILSTLLESTVSIEMQVPNRLLLQNNTCLGKTVLALSDNFLLGEAMVVCNKLNIRVDALSNEKVMQLLSSKNKNQPLIKYIKRYLGPLVHFDLIFTMRANADILQLGKSILSLGHTTFIAAGNNLSYSVCLADKQWNE